MRIIAGSAKGRRLATPRGLDTRPLTGRAKEALFSSLGDRIVGARVLDLFAGSGSMGLEALSRGAAAVIFVERARPALDALEKNVAELGIGGTIVAGDATAPRCAAAGHSSFDFVFIDPPYALDAAVVVGILEETAPLMAAAGVVIVHRRRGEAMPQVVGSLSAVSQRRYGDAELWRYEAQEEVPQ